MARNTLIQVRRDTASNWTSTNPTLAAGEIGFESNTGLLKVGDGSTAWSSLAYAAVTASNTATLTNKTIALGSNTVSGTISEFNSAVTDADLATRAGSETLTNKTLALGSNTISGTVSQFNTALTDGDFATLAGSETLTNKTLTSPTVNTPTITRPTITMPIEAWNLTGTAAGGSMTVDLITSSLWWYTNAATANFSLNFRGNGSTTLNSALATGQSVSASVMVVNASNYYLSGAVAIDGSSQTVNWLGGQAPTSGFTSGFDLYSFTIVKYGSAQYVVLGSLSRFV